MTIGSRGYCEVKKGDKDVRAERKKMTTGIEGSKLMVWRFRKGRGERNVYVSMAFVKKWRNAGRIQTSHS